MTNVELFRKDMKEKLESYASQLGLKSFNDSSTRAKGDVFLRYFVSEFLMNEFPDLDEDLLESAIIDGSNDLGMDFLFDDDSSIVIIQAKYGKGQVTREVLSGFSLIPSRVRDIEYIKRKGNAYLKEIVAGVSRLTTKPIRLILVHDQEIQEPEKWETSIETSNADVECSIYDFNALKSEFVRISSQADQAPEYIDISVGGEDVFRFRHVDPEYPTVLVTQKGSKIKSLYMTHKEPLFNLNIRYWLGRNPVNKRMVETIGTTPESFFYYNNGITAVCESVEDVQTQHGDFLRCKNLQIINGAQTVTTIAREGDESKLSTVRVQLKIIEVEAGKQAKSEESLFQNIVKNTNNQTAITVSDFRSNDEIQYFLESAIKKIEYRGVSPHKKLLYRRKRSKVTGHRNDITITMQDLGKIFYSSFFDPVELNAAVSRLWDDSPRGLYYSAFGIEGERVAYMPPSRVYSMLAAYFIHSLVKARCKGLDKKKHPHQLFKLHICFGIVELIRLKHPFSGTSESIFEQMIESGLCLNSDLHPSSCKKFERYYDTVADSIDFLVTEMEDSGTIVMRNLQRSKSFMEKVEKYIRAPHMLKLLEELI